MQIRKILMGLAFCALSVAVAAQPRQPEVLQDTLVIRMEGSNQIHLTGASLAELIKYREADSLKQLFVADVRKAFVQGSLAEMPQRLHYLISANGKRRLKAQLTAGEEAAFDLDREKARLRLDLPLNHFTIYDLRGTIQMNIYLEDSLALNQLEEARIAPAQQEVAQERKKLKRTVKYTVQKQGDLYITRGTEGNRIDLISIEPQVGAALIGNQPSPLIGAAISLTLHNKYAVPSYKIGYAVSGYMLPSESENFLSDLNPGMIYDLSFALNQAKKSGKTNWYGIQLGIISNDRNRIIQENAPKAGIFNSRGALTYGIDFIRLPYNRGIYMFTIKASF